MAQFSDREQDTMRREAMRRTREMQKQAPPKRVAMPSRTPMLSAHADTPPKSTVQPTPQSEQPHANDSPLFAGLLPQWGNAGLLPRMDGDAILILAMMAMLYQDGGWNDCDKKLLMALAYLLT